MTFSKELKDRIKELLELNPEKLSNLHELRFKLETKLEDSRKIVDDKILNGINPSMSEKDTYLFTLEIYSEFMEEYNNK